MKTKLNLQDLLVESLIIKNETELKGGTAAVASPIYANLPVTVAAEADIKDGNDREDNEEE